MESTGTIQNAVVTKLEVLRPGHLYDDCYVTDDGVGVVMIGFERGEPSDGPSLWVTRVCADKLAKLLVDHRDD